MIACTPAINFGQPALAGRRLTVFNIVTKIYYEDAVQDALTDYEISLQDAMDAVTYCANLKCKQDETLVQFCDGCILRTIHDGWNFKKDDYIETETDGIKTVISKDGMTLFAGSLSELEDSEFGKVTWLMAEEALQKLNKQYPR
jgi:uncharacterized protein (DUF433 family)